MLSPTKQAKMLDAMKLYKKNYLDKVNNAELDESSTRIFINNFLSDVLGYSLIDEIKTEFMIRGTYADYMIQINGERHFLVEVKAFSLMLSEKHLRQTLNYGANEGIEYALLTNGHSFELHKILFTQPINSALIFSVELSDLSSIKKSVEILQFLHKDAVLKGSLEMLWDKCEALNKFTVCGMLLSEQVLGTVKGLIRKKYGQKCSDEEVAKVIQEIIRDEIEPDAIKPFKKSKERQRKLAKVESASGKIPDLPAILPPPENEKS